MLVDNFANRLNEAISIRNIKPAEIVKRSEVLYSNGKINKALTKPLLSNYQKGNYEAKQDNIYALALILDVDEAWLMGADVPMQREFDKNITGVDKKVTSSATVFVYGTIPAGTPIELIEDVLDTEEIDSDMLKGGKQYFGLKIKGTSMFPEYLDGDVIILQKVDDVESGTDACVMVNGNDGTFKRIFKNENGIILQPLNPEFQPMVYTNEQIEKLPIKVIGKVVELRRKK